MTFLDRADGSDLRYGEHRLLGTARRVGVEVEIRHRAMCGAQVYAYGKAGHGGKIGFREIS